MWNSVLAVLACLMGGGPLAEAPGTDLHYRFQLSQMDRNGTGAAVRDYDAHVLVTGGGPRQTMFVLDDVNDTLPWFGRFGQTSGAGAAPQVVNHHRHDGVIYPLTQSLPTIATPKLGDEAEWEDGQTTYRVAGTRKSGEWDCWVVEISDSLGRRGVTLIDREDGIIVAASQRVFMGQGDRFELTARLDSAKALSEAELAEATKLSGDLQTIQKGLGFTSRDVGVELSAEQLASVDKELPALSEAARGTVFERLATVIGRDVKAHQQRATAVADLTQKFVGQLAPPLKLKSMDGADIDPASLKGQVVVLHFWEYRDAPLTEPYGQIGYLDYLSSRRSSQGVKVLGVAVDSRLGAPETRPAAVRSIRKLREFMNVGYDVAVDHGDVVRSFGDPRQYSAALPLWVVIGADGKVLHYRSGLYKVDVNRGLEELDAVVAQALKARG
jgi:peroxiredoxin